MKKLFKIFLSLVLFISLFSGCDPYDGKRPYDYPAAKWTCTDPDMWFNVVDKTAPMGIIKTDEGSKDIVLRFGNGDGVEIYWCDKYGVSSSYRDERIIGGKCEFSKHKLVIKVDHDTVFNNKYKELVFIREEDK